LLYLVQDWEAALTEILELVVVKWRALHWIAALPWNSGSRLHPFSLKKPAVRMMDTGCPPPATVLQELFENSLLVTHVWRIFLIAI
jgi:hypothetical protein